MSYLQEIEYVIEVFWTLVQFGSYYGRLHADKEGSAMGMLCISTPFWGDDHGLYISLYLHKFQNS